MSLKFVEPSAQPPTLNILAYGGPGVGKTVGACSAPGPVLALNAEGENALRFARRHYGNDKVHEVAVEGKQTLTDAYLHLRGGGEEKTVVVDSLGEVFRVLLDERSGGGKPTLPQYGDATTDLERFCRSLIQLPVNVVLIAHEISVKDESTGVLERLPATGTSNPALGVKLMTMVDVVGYFGRVEAAEPNGDTQFVAQLVDANGRRGKDRTDTLGKYREVDIEHWLTLYAGAEATDHRDRTQTNGKPAATARAATRKEKVSA